MTAPKRLLLKLYQELVQYEHTERDDPATFTVTKASLEDRRRGARELCAYLGGLPLARLESAIADIWRGAVLEMRAHWQNIDVLHPIARYGVDAKESRRRGGQATLGTHRKISRERVDERYRQLATTTDWKHARICREIAFELERERDPEMDGPNNHIAPRSIERLTEKHPDRVRR